MIEHPISLFLDEILEHMKEYQDEIENAQTLFENVFKYSQAKSSKSRSRQTLILKQYGGEKELRKFCLDCCKKLNRIKKSIYESNQKLEELLTHKTLKCYTCMGQGSFTKPLYVRERGSLRQRTIQVVDCPECDGRGKVSLNINLESEVIIKQFFEFVTYFDSIFDCTITCMRNLIKALGGGND